MRSISFFCPNVLSESLTGVKRKSGLVTVIVVGPVMKLKFGPVLY